MLSPLLEFCAFKLSEAPRKKTAPERENWAVGRSSLLRKLKCLTENIANLVYESFIFKIFGFDSRKLLGQSPLFSGQGSWRDHTN